MSWLRLWLLGKRHYLHHVTRLSIFTILHMSPFHETFLRASSLGLYFTRVCCDKSRWVDFAWLLHADVVLLRDYWSLSLRYSAATLAVGAISRFHLPHPVIQSFCVCHYLCRPDFSSFTHRLLELDIHNGSPLAPSSSGRKSWPGGHLWRPLCSLVIFTFGSPSFFSFTPSNRSQCWADSHSLFRFPRSLMLHKGEKGAIYYSADKNIFQSLIYWVDFFPVPFVNVAAIRGLWVLFDE